MELIKSKNKLIKDNAELKTQLNSRCYLPERINIWEDILLYNIDNIESRIEYVYNENTKSVNAEICSHYIIRGTNSGVRQICIPQYFEGDDYDFEEKIGNDWMDIPKAGSGKRKGKIRNGDLWKSNGTYNKTGCMFELTEPLKINEILEIKITNKVVSDINKEKIFTHRTLLGVKEMKIVVNLGRGFKFNGTPTFIAKCQGNPIDNEVKALSNTVSFMRSKTEITIERPIPYFEYGFEFSIKPFQISEENDVVDC